MPSHLKELCDAVIDSLELPSENFEEKIRQVFCKMDEAYKLTGLNDTIRAEEFSYECRHILVVLRLFPIELQLAMGNLYKKTLWGFLSIYLDFKMMLIDDQPNKEAYFKEVMKDIFILLGDEDKTGIWSVVVTSHTLNRIEILRLIARQCIEATKTKTYDHEQYIRMIWVLHVFFSQCKRSGFKDDADKVLNTALKLKQPPGLCKWMCHHFPGFGWKGLSDANVHETLVSEKQPKSFFRQVYQSISKDDTLKYLLDDPSTNGARDEDSSSQCSDSNANVTKRRVNSSPQKESEASQKKTRTDSESRVDLDKSTEDKSKKTITEKSKAQEKEKSKQDALENSFKSKNLDDSSKKSDSSSKPSKTLGPGRSKPISRSSFLDDDDTVDTNIDGGDDNADNESDESKQADKENKKKSDTQTEEDVCIVKKDKVSVKKKVDVSSDDEEPVKAKGEIAEARSKRSTRNQGTRSAKVLPSDSETDIDETIEETKKRRASKTGKRKVNDDSDDSDHTIAESDITVETNANGDIDEASMTKIGRRTGKKSNLRSQSAGKKPQPKKMKNDPSIQLETTIERLENDEEGDKQQPNKSVVCHKVAYTDDTEIQKLLDEYETGPYKRVFEEFEEQKMQKGAEPFINLSSVPFVCSDAEKEATLADVLYNNKQKAKEQKAGPSRKKKSRR